MPACRSLGGSTEPPFNLMIFMKHIIMRVKALGLVCGPCIKAFLSKLFIVLVKLE